MGNIIIMYRTKILTILGFLLINFCIYSQSNYRDKTITQCYNIGIPTDSIFFQEIESILKREKLYDYKFYEIIIIPQVKDCRKILFELRGIKTPFDDHLYMVNYQNKTYMMDGKFLNILFKKGHVFRLEHTAYLTYEDIMSPILTLEYFEKKLLLTNKETIF